MPVRVIVLLLAAALLALAAVAATVFDYRWSGLALAFVAAGVALVASGSKL